MIATNLGEYLTSYGGRLVEQLEQSNVPLVDEGYRSHPEMQLLREPYPAQWDRAEAIVAAWKSGQSAILSGKTGTGKTIVATVAAAVHAAGKPFRALVYCPGHLTRKWVREVHLTIPEARAEVIGGYKDLVALQSRGAPDGPEFYAMSDSKAKLGTKWRPAAVIGSQLVLDVNDLDLARSERREPRRVVSETLHCPNCHQMVMRSISDAGSTVEVPATMKELAKSQCRCEGCGEALFQWLSKSQGGFDRWPCADFINRRMSGWFDYFVLDESHTCKSPTSASGQSSAQLASVIEHKIAMTGTLLNGYADSLFPTLFRFDSPRMVSLDFKWSDSMEFVKRYGRLETVTVSEDLNPGNANRMSKGRQLSKKVSVKPGIVPGLYGDCMMGNTVFLQLEDMGFKLPEQKNFLHGVDMDPDQSMHYEQMEMELRSGLAAMLRSGSKRAMSMLLNTLIGWPDHPHGFGGIGYQDQDGLWNTVCEPPDLNPEVVRAKELELVNVVVDAVNRGNQAWVYTVMTGKRDVQVRLQQLLAKEGLDCRILRSKQVPTDKREEWIEKNGAADCMIMHPQLVATGLDAFDAVGGRFNFNSLIFYSTGYVLDTVRQASGRARRIGQTKDCELHFMFYRGTMQEQAALLMSEKTKAAESIDGNFTDTGLASLAGNDDNTAMLLVKTLMQSEALAV